MKRYGIATSFKVWEMGLFSQLMVDIFHRYYTPYDNITVLNVLFRKLIKKSTNTKKVYWTFRIIERCMEILIRNMLKSTCLPLLKLKGKNFLRIAFLIYLLIHLLIFQY